MVDTRSEPVERKPTRRRWPWVLLALGVPIVALVALLPRWLDLESHRGRIENALSEATGWQVELGDLDFSILGGPVVTARPVRLTAPEGGSRFVVDSLGIRADWKPLFRGHLNLTAIELDRPVVDLVRPDEEQGWVLPKRRATKTETRTDRESRSDGSTAEPSSPRKSRLAISIDRVRIQGGKLHIEDRVSEPPLVMDFEDLGADIAVAAGTLSGRATLVDDGGTLSCAATTLDRIVLDLDGVRTETLHPILGRDLIREGGRLSGQLQLSLPDAVEGTLGGKQLWLLAGERPLDLDVDFRARQAGAEAEPTWEMERLELRSGQARIVGAGTLTPALDLTLELEPTTTEQGLELARGLFPFPLELTPPGTTQVTVRVMQPPGEDLVFSAEGEVSAARFAPGGVMPPAHDVKSRFRLGIDGAVELDLLEGSVAGGPLRGTVRLDRLDPPGTLTFDGKLAEAALGSLIDGLVQGAGQKISGPTGLDAKVRLDLARSTLDARSLGGRLELGAVGVSLPGWDLERAIRRAIEERLGRLASIVSSVEDAPTDRADVPRLFDRLDAVVDFDELPWTLERFVVVTSDLSSTGRGEFDPITGSLDLRLDSRWSVESSSRLVERYPYMRQLVRDDGRIAVPLTLRGNVLSPKIDVELRELLQIPSDSKDRKEAIKDLLKGLIDRK